MIDARYVSVLVAILSLSFGIYQWYLNRKVSKLSIEIDSSLIANAKRHDDIQVIVAGNEKPSSRVVLSVIRFQNSGNLSISKEALTPKMELEFDISGKSQYPPARVLFVRRTKCSNLATQWNVSRSEDENLFSVSFDVLNPKQGFEIQVFHEAEQYGAIRCRSQIKDGSIVQLDPGDTESNLFTFWEFPVFMAKMFAFFILIAYWNDALNKPFTSGTLDCTLMMAASLIAGGTLQKLFFSGRRRQRIVTASWNAPTSE